MLNLSNDIGLSNEFQIACKTVCILCILNNQEFLLCRLFIHHQHLFTDISMHFTILAYIKIASCHICFLFYRYFRIEVCVVYLLMYE